MNEELKALFDADRHERINLIHNEAYYRMLHEHDEQRHLRAQALIDEGSLSDTNDYHHAAVLFHHGDSLEDIWQAHTLALKAVELGSHDARWLSAAAMDRWLIYSGKPQKYGTQFLWDVEPEITDDERAEWDVIPLAEQIEQVAEASRDRQPMPVDENAPQWLKDILKQWGV
jgi:hypothetical protein